MKASEIRELAPEEMVQKEHDLKEELFNLRFQFFTGQLENTQRLTQIRRDIARVKTMQRELQLKVKKEG